ncbi:hypothetical protein MBLNU457_g0254t1 [Dothideomycetes sp. NU457]
MSQQIPGGEASTISTKPEPSASESDSRQASSGSSRKRASRAGTRSVTTLSTAQLERKRANDREAQRAIRARTRETIEGLEKNLANVKAELETRERLLAAANTRTHELEEENTYLRNRVGATGPDSSFMVHVSGSEVGIPPQSSPLSRYAGAEIQRPPSQDTRRSISATNSHSSAQPAAWRQQQSFSVEPSAPITTQRHDSAREPWRTPSEMASTLTVPSTGSHTSVDQIQRTYSGSSQSERPAWSSNTNSYGYMADPNQQQGNYQALNRSIPYPSPAPPQSAYSSQSALPAPTIHSAPYGPPITPSSDFQGMSLQSPASASSAVSQSVHEHPSGGHTPYSVSPHYHGSTTQPTIQRHSLTPGATQPYPSAGLHGSQLLSTGYHSAQNQPQYQYGQYNENG